LDAWVYWRGCDGLDGCYSSCLGLGGVVGELEVCPHPPKRSVVIFGAATEVIVTRSRLNLIYVALNKACGCLKNKYHTAYGPIDDSFYPLFSPGVIFGKYFFGAIRTGRPCRSSAGLFPSEFGVKRVTYALPHTKINPGKTTAIS